MLSLIVELEIYATATELVKSSGYFGNGKSEKKEQNGSKPSYSKPCYFGHRWEQILLYTHAKSSRSEQ